MASVTAVYSPRGGVPLPSRAVIDMETAIEQGARVNTEIRQHNGFPFRPGYGSPADSGARGFRGDPVTLFTNHFELNAHAKLELHLYSIKVSPKAVGRKRVQIIKLLMNTSLSAVAERMLTDFNTLLYCRQRSKQDTTSFNITYRAEEESSPSTNATQYTVSLTYSKTLRVSDLMSYLTSTDPLASYGDETDMIRALNVFFDHFAKASGDLVKVGANKIFSLAPGTPTCNLGNGLHAIRGFSASVRPATGRILVNVQVKNGAFYNAGRLDQLMESFSPDP
jgi:eukaryotic translation initiation factor 2C